MPIEKEQISGCIEELYKTLTDNCTFLSYSDIANIRDESGVYIFFDNDCKININGRQYPRIIRVGESSNLRNRLKNHFNGNGTNSKFCHLVGSTIIQSKENKQNILYHWINKTPLQNINENEQEEIRNIRAEVQKYIRKLNFVIISIKEDENRKQLEASLISTLSWYHLFERPASKNWQENKILQTGLWCTQGAFGEPISKNDIKIIKQGIKQS